MSLKNPVTRPGIDPETVRLVAQRLNHYATPGLPCEQSAYHESEEDQPRTYISFECLICGTTRRILMKLGRRGLS